LEADISGSFGALVFFLFTLSSKLLFFQIRAMNYFAAVKSGSQTPRVHPLLLSLSETWKVSDTSSDIHSISEDDPRVIGSCYYVSPSELPPLNPRFERQAVSMLVAI
jgi:hypothetical protein